MPTGYTADVVDGKVTDFKTFALRCARNFGALVMMRDDALDAPIPEEFKPSDFYEKELVKAKAELARVTSLTWQRCNEEEREERSRLLAAHQKHVDECRAVRDRLLAMRSQVADWQPPTPDHQGLKDFMIQQLDETMRFDAQPGTYYLDKASIRTGEQWRADQIEELNDRIERYTEEVRKENERTAARNKWVADLRRSLV